MSRSFPHTTVSRRKGAAGFVCAQRTWANIADRGNVVGTKREPQPMTYEGKAPDA